MVKINYNKCLLCKKCVNICHTSCMSIVENLIKIDPKMCSTCCQCIACCPNGALTWDDIETREIITDKLPNEENFLEMLKARRSVRKFLNKPIEKEKLEIICHTAKLSPTNSYDIELMVIQKQEIIAELEKININFINNIYQKVYANRFIFKFISHISNTVNEIDKKKMENTLKRKIIFQNAPVLILVIANPKIYHAELSCQYALYNMSLMAQSMGIGSCISGAGKRILSKNKNARKILEIPNDKELMGILFMGYPAVQFKRTVEGNYPKIYWK